MRYLVWPAGLPTEERLEMVHYGVAAPFDGAIRGP